MSQLARISSERAVCRHCHLAIYEDVSGAAAVWALKYGDSNGRDLTVCDASPTAKHSPEVAR